MLLAISQMIWWSSSPKSNLSPNFLCCMKGVWLARESASKLCICTSKRTQFSASGPSILLRLKGLTATTISNVSAPFPPKSQLHLDYCSTVINTLELLSVKKALCCCKDDLNVMKLRPQANADILCCIQTSWSWQKRHQGHLWDYGKRYTLLTRFWHNAQLPAPFLEDTPIFCFIAPEPAPYCAFLHISDQNNKFRVTK